MTDRAVLACFAVVALGGGAGVIVPTHDHFAAQDRVRAARRAGLGAVRASSVRQILAAIERQSPADAVVQDMVFKRDDTIVLVEDPAKGSVRTFGLDDSGTLRAEGTSDATSDTGLDFSEIDPAAPERAARAVLARAGQPLSALEEVVASVSAPHQLRWAINLQHTPVRDREWLSDARGGHVRRNG